MAVVDVKRLSPVSQEDLRRRVVAAVESGRTQAEVAETFGVGLRSVSRWVNTFRASGNKGLKARKRGRRPEEQKALTARAQARVKRAVVGKFPDQLALPGLVWTRGQIAELIERWFGIRLSRVTIGKYLRSWGLSPQKPIRVAYERDPEAAAGWVERDYPAIAARGRKEQAVILWLDQTGLRSDAAVAATWAPTGQTPVVPKAGVRFGVNAMSAISNKGELYFTVFTGGFNASIMIGFLKRLIRQLDRKIYLIADRHPVHRARLLTDWLARHHDRIEMHFLPGYCPELNPVELLNGDVKHHVTATTNPRTKSELAAATRTHLRRRQNQPDHVRALFGKEEVRYAAD
ncbi:IS630 family transposase [Saccharopolyspora elongata]|uniref:IS630 family transposase n=1 Tax=Saccharopolyspora elongata TaxID=2530387 RepID=UPI001A9CDE84|nr:IS630 family transposase [Saccharopolyspora elongata]